MPHLDILIKELISAVPNISGIMLNFNRRHDNVILSNEEKIIYGQSYISETFMDLQFAVSSRSFMQVNPEQTEVLYRRALEAAGLSGSETVVDAYCGIGTMTLLFAQHARFVYGIECVRKQHDFIIESY